MALELLKLYSRRRLEFGFIFTKDTMQRVLACIQSDSVPEHLKDEAYKILANILHQDDLCRKSFMDELDGVEFLYSGICRCLATAMDARVIFVFLQLRIGFLMAAQCAGFAQCFLEHNKPDDNSSLLVQVRMDYSFNPCMV
jgi:hypothetical protein